MERQPKNKHLGLHIDAELHYKLRFISDYDGRSVSGEVLYLIRQRILEFERENGTILLPPEGE